MSVMWDSEQLRREASIIHRGIFGRDVPPEITREYVNAHDMALLQTDASQTKWMRAALARNVDFEALEFVLRRRDPEHILCRKMRLLIYVAEAFPEYYDDFVNERPRRLRAFSTLAVYAFWTPWKFVKGWCLLRKMGREHV